MADLPKLAEPVMRPRDSAIELVQDGVVEKSSSTFWRGEGVNFYPKNRSLDRQDAPEEYIAKGLMPSSPMIRKETVTVAFGSCFAAHLSNHLADLGFGVDDRSETKAYISTMGDGIVNTYAIRQQFEWAFNGRVPEVPLWHGYDGSEFGYDEAVRLRTREIFEAAEVFVLTLGLSEVWYDEPSGEVFWRAVPMDRVDPSRHKFRMTTVAENVENLDAIRTLIRRHRPEATIVLTLSPVALAATFRPIACIAANGASKAVLRAAADEILRMYPDDRSLYYFPSYEVVTSCFERPFIDDRRHPHWTAIDFNLALFERYFCQTGKTDADLRDAWRQARQEDARLAAMTPAEANAVFVAETERRAQKRKIVRDAELAKREQERSARLAAARPKHKPGE